MFAFGALFLKRSTHSGINNWTQIFVANLIAATLFSSFLVLDGTFYGVQHLWQPAVVGLAYVVGQILILSAVHIGDVSVATPVASSKVLVVAGLATLFTETEPTTALWIAAALAAVGVTMINFVVPKSDRSVVLKTVMLAFGGGASFAVFDICLSSFAPNWGTGYIIPLSFWFVGFYSLCLYPLTDRSFANIKNKLWKSLLLGAALVAVQGGFLAYALATNSDDATGINVVYSLRGMWGVLFAWLLAGYFGGREANMPRGVMVSRLAGALLLVAAVVITICSRTG